MESIQSTGHLFLTPQCLMTKKSTEAPEVEVKHRQYESLQHFILSHSSSTPSLESSSPSTSSVSVPSAPQPQPQPQQLPQASSRDESTKTEDSSSTFDIVGFFLNAVSKQNMDYYNNSSQQPPQPQPSILSLLEAKLGPSSSPTPQQATQPESLASQKDEILSQPMKKEPSPTRQRSPNPSERWAGAAFCNSPSSGSLPRPAFAGSPTKRSSEASVAPEAAQQLIITSIPLEQTAVLSSSTAGGLVQQPSSPTTSPRSTSTKSTHQQQQHLSKSQSAKSNKPQRGKTSPPTSAKRQYVPKKTDSSASSQQRTTTYRDVVQKSSAAPKQTSPTPAPVPALAPAPVVSQSHRDPSPSHDLDQLSSYLRNVLKIGVCPS